MALPPPAARVALFTLGGTIAMAPGASGVVPALTGQQLLDPVKARLLLHVLLAGGAARAEIRAAFRAAGR